MVFKRKIKSFVRRQRRLTPRLQKALTDGWSRFGTATQENEKLNLEKIFNRAAPTILEIGFGHGDTLIPMATEHPDQNYVGIEVHEPGVAAVMAGVIENNLTNIRVIQNDAVKILQNNIADHTLSRVHIYFPDPWPKKKHHKRRIIQPEFVDLLKNKLVDGGVFHFATDWEDYAKQVMLLLSAHPAFKNCIGENQFAENEKLLLRANTKFEMRGKKLGHGVWDLIFQKRAR